MPSTLTVVLAAPTSLRTIARDLTGIKMREAKEEEKSLLQLSKSRLLKVELGLGRLRPVQLGATPAKHLPGPDACMLTRYLGLVNNIPQVWFRTSPHLSLSASRPPLRQVGGRLPGAKRAIRGGSVDTSPGCSGCISTLEQTHSARFARSKSNAASIAIPQESCAGSGSEIGISLG